MLIKTTSRLKIFWKKLQKNLVSSKISTNFAVLLRRTPTQSEWGDSLAQLVEHNTFNVGVLGSSPRRITKGFGRTPQSTEISWFSVLFFLVKLQDNAEYYLQACTKRVHRVSCTKMYTVTRKGPQQVEDCTFAEIQLWKSGVLRAGTRPSTHNSGVTWWILTLFKI